MTVLAVSAACMARFDALVRLIGARGHGPDWRELTDCWALARELEAETPDLDQGRALAKRLGLDPDSLTGSIS